MIKVVNIRRILKDAGVMDINLLDNAVKEVLKMQEIVPPYKYSIYQNNILSGTSDHISDTNDWVVALEEYNKQIDLHFSISDTSFSINNETGREYTNDTWYEYI